METVLDTCGTTSIVLNGPLPFRLAIASPPDCAKVRADATARRKGSYRRERSCVEEGDKVRMGPVEVTETSPWLPLAVAVF